MVYDSLYILLNSVCKYFVENFCIYNLRGIVIFVVSLSGFGIRVIVASYNEFGSVSTSSNFWTTLRRVGISSSLYVWQNSPMKASGPGLLFAGRFFCFVSTNSVLLLVIGLFRLFLPGSVLEDCIFLEIYLFLLGCPMC